MNNIWSPWAGISFPSNYSGPAVYKVRLLNGEEVLKIPRFLGADIEGILCIGVTDNFERRLAYFIRGLSGSEIHSEAHLLSLLRMFTNFNESISKPFLQYSFRKVSTTDEAKLTEEILIKAYVSEYGEVPPLNSAIPSRKSLKGWKAAQALRLS